MAARRVGGGRTQPLADHRDAHHHVAGDDERKVLAGHGIGDTGRQNQHAGHLD